MKTNPAANDDSLLRWLYYHPGISVGRIGATAPTAVRSIRDASEAGLATAIAGRLDVGMTVRRLEATGFVSRVGHSVHLTPLGRATAYSQLEGMALDASVSWLRQTVAKLGPGLVVDIGGGSGRLLEVALNADQLGAVLDNDRPTVEASRGATSPNLQFVVGDAHHLPFTSASVSSVVSRISFMYLDERQVFSELGRVLAPRGRALLINVGPGYLLSEFRGALGSFGRVASAGVLAVNTAVFVLGGRPLRLGGHRDHLQPRARVLSLAARAGLRLVESGPSGIAFASRSAYYLLLERL